MNTLATTTPAVTLCNYIGGTWRASESGQQLERRNPANHADLLGYAPLSSRAEARAAIDAALAAFPGWRDTPAPVRGKYLLQLARVLERERDQLARLLTREEGKTVAESTAEINRSINILEYIAGEARRLKGEALPSETPGNIVYTMRQPLGVVGLITPWNFPVAIPVWKIAPALVCGNAVVWKPSELTPFTSQALMELVIECELPAGVVNLVYGVGEEVGDEIVGDSRVAAISFTGSTKVGALINRKAAAQMKKVQCEMGGKNPIIVLTDADLERAADAAVSGAFASSGQRCTATSRVIVENRVADEFVTLLRQKMLKLNVGDGADPRTHVGPSVSEEQYKKVLDYIDIGKREARLVAGGDALRRAPHDAGYFIAPALFDYVSPESRIAQEEIFGPVLSVTRVDDFDAAVRAANCVPYGLAASVYTRDARRVFESAERIDCGMLHINSPTVGGEAHVPFGGCKASGFGERETGSTAIDFYSEWKVVYVDYR